MANEFATAAFRMGHSLIRDRFTRLDALQQVYRNRNYLFDEVVFKSDHAYEYKSLIENKKSIKINIKVLIKLNNTRTELNIIRLNN